LPSKRRPRFLFSFRTTQHQQPEGKAKMHPIRSSAEDAVVTRSFGCAVFLHALGHPIEHVRSRDGSAFNAYFHFPPTARRDLERYYAARDVLNATAARFLSPTSPTNSEENTDVADDHR